MLSDDEGPSSSYAKDEPNGFGDDEGFRMLLTGFEDAADAGAEDGDDLTALRPLGYWAGSR